MPELPEVETIRRTLLPRVVGCTITGVTVRQRRLRLPVHEAQLRRRAVGQMIWGLDRRGKYLLLRLSNAHTLVIHLGMTGQLVVEPAPLRYQPHDHLIFHLGPHVQLRFHDTRRFGLVLVVSDRFLDRHPCLRHLGPEPLSRQCTAAYLQRRSKGLKRPVKNFLIDGRMVAGVGNIYACEALFLGGVDPRRPVGQIGKEGWQRIVASLKQVLRKALVQGGTSFSDYVDGNGRPGYFQVSLRVYGRQGEPCHRCQEPVRRLLQAGRSTFFCPRCQCG